MRRLPVLRHDQFIFTRLKALAWVGNQSTLPTLLQADGGRILSYIAEHDEPEKPLILDCRGVVEIDDHALETTRAALQKHSRTLVLINADQLDARLKRDLGDFNVRFGFSSTQLAVVGDDGSIDREVASRLIEQVAIIERNYVRECVAGCYRKFPRGMERMASTPLLASGVFDARLLISESNKFVWTAMLMADKLEEYLDGVLQTPTPGTTAQPLKQFRLLAVSLRGSPFAAAVGLLTSRHRSVEIVDHMGPKYKILEEPSLRATLVEDDYIYVGDFVIGGTELRIAQAYARSKGSQLKHAIVVGKVLETADYNLDFDISALVNLKECCPTLRFEF